LVTISIISLVAAVGIPNIKKFNTNQDFNNASNDFLTMVKQVQHNAMSGVQCSNGEIAESWRMEIDGGDTYKIICVPVRTGVGVAQSISLPSPAVFYATGCENPPVSASFVRARILFKGSNVYFYCFYPTLQSADPSIPIGNPNNFDIFLKNSTNSSVVNKDIKINIGGAINMIN
jgi:hypothetical protein